MARKKPVKSSDFDAEGWVEGQERANTERRVERIRATASEWKAIARVYARERDEAEAKVEALIGMSEAQSRARPIRPLAKRGDRHSLSTPVLVLSDWHVDETVNPAEVPGGKNRFNSSIAEQRLDNLWRNSVKLINSFRSATTIHDCVAMCLGDHFSGWIHTELRSSTEMSPTDSVDWLFPRITAGLDYLAKHGDFEKIYVPTCPGNHSRITEKEESVPAKASLEYLMFRFLARHYEEHPQIEVYTSRATRNVIPIGNTLVRYMHGNQWRSRGGIGGITTPMQTAMSRWNERADHSAFGHWHQYTPGPRWTGNGSLIGHTAFGAKYGPWEPPQQAMFLVSHKHGVTMQAPIFCE